MLDSFLKILGGEPADEIVWTADLTYWVAGQAGRDRRQPEWNQEEGHLRLCRELGVMPYYWYEPFMAGQPVYDGVEVGSGHDGDRSWQTWKTSQGELRQETVKVEGGASEAITKYPVECEGDLQVLLSIIERRHLEPAGLNGYAERAERWAEDDGLPALGLPRSPLPGLFVEWTGLQNGVYLLMDYPERIGRILSLMEEQEQPLLEAICRAGPPLIHFPDNLTSESYTGYFRRWMEQPYRRRLERLRGAGIRTAVHLDGTVRGLLPRLVRVGFDAIEALTPQPAGDVAVEEMRSLAGSDTVVLWGGVPGAMFSPPFTWNDMERHVGGLLEAWRGTPFIVGVADQVPPNGDLGFVSRIADMLKSCGAGAPRR